MDQSINFVGFCHIEIKKKILSMVRNLPDDEVRLVGREPGDPRGLDNPSPSLPNNVDTGNAG